MHRPSVNFFAKSFLPTTKYPFALQVSDYRLLWAINSGSVSNIAYIPVYEPASLDEQLDTVMK